MLFVFFDFDDILIDGDCVIFWGCYMIELGWVEKIVFLYQECCFMEFYVEGWLVMEDYMDFSLVFIVGCILVEIVGVVEDFVVWIIVLCIYVDVLCCLECYCQVGDCLLIIFVLVYFLVSVIGCWLGVDEVLVIDIEECDGFYIGCICGIFIYCEGKVCCFDVWLVQEGEMLVGVIFYFDLCNDLLLFLWVDWLYMVNFDLVLFGYVCEVGWLVLEWC